MLFKRKEVRPPGLNEFAQLKEHVVDQLSLSNYHTVHSASFHAEKNGNTITYDQLKKNRLHFNKILLPDVCLFYIASTSIFSKNYYNVIPLAVKKDSYHRGHGIMRVLGEGNTFTVHKKALNKVHGEGLVYECYSSRVVERITSAIKSEKFYNNDQFAWTSS